MGGGCFYGNSDLISNEVDKKRNCFSYVEQVEKYLIKNGKKEEIVFVGQSLIFQKRLQNSEKYLSFLNQLSLKLEQNEMRLVLLDSTAGPKGMKTRRCFKEIYRPFPEKCELSKKEVIERYLIFDQVASDFSLNNKNLFYARLRDGLCIEEICGTHTEKGNVIWIDFGHITDNAAADLSETLKKRLQEQRFVF